MSPLRSCTALLALSGLACALGGKTQDAVDQDPACAAYLDCLTALDPGAVGVALESYGEDGTCWTSESAAEACADACAQAIAAAHQVDPAEPACDDGSSVSTLTLLGADAPWQFDAGAPEADCGYPVGLLDLDAALQGSEGPEFAIVGELEIESLVGSPARYPVDLACTLDGVDFTCTTVVVEQADPGESHLENLLDLEGQFGTTYQTADLVAHVRVEVDGAVDCEAVTALTGTGG